jgi:hypothetical protein
MQSCKYSVGHEEVADSFFLVRVMTASDEGAALSCSFLCWHRANSKFCVRPGKKLQKQTKCLKLFMEMKPYLVRVSSNGIEAPERREDLEDDRRSGWPSSALNLRTVV